MSLAQELQSLALEIREPWRKLRIHGPGQCGVRTYWRAIAKQAIRDWTRKNFREKLRQAMSGPKGLGQALAMLGRG